MHLKHKRVQADGSAVGDAAPQGSRLAAARSSRAPLAPARLQPDRGYLTSADGAVPARRQQIAAGQLVVRWERRRAALTIWLSGALDEATAALLDRELDARAIGTMRLIVDLTGLEFIDSPGRDSLLRIHQRASEHGDRLSFRHGPHVAQQPLELTRTVRLRSSGATRHAAVSDEDAYFALAMACADVDHLAPGDRPRAA
jgi:anti-anti-sigma factor